MGDVVNSMKRAQRNGRAWTLVLAATLISSGCLAASTESVAQSSAPVPPAAAPASMPATISRLAVVEGAPGTRIELAADSALVWSSYRDADGALVIELPNARPATGVKAENPASGLVSSVDVAVDETAGRPLTRLTVRTRQEAEHTLLAAHNGLSIEMLPSGATPTTVSAVDATEATDAAAPAIAIAAPSAPQAQVAEPASATSLAAFGTPDRPLVAPPPTGRLATLLGSVDVAEEGEGTVVRITGDGNFAYSTFQLANPDRFVIDLDGVVNQSARSSAPLDGNILARIRVSQFKQRPEPVSRVVFDLRQTVPPTIERGPQGLVVRFGAAASTAARSDFGARGGRASRRNRRTGDAAAGRQVGSGRTARRRGGAAAGSRDDSGGHPTDAAARNGSGNRAVHAVHAGRRREPGDARGERRRGLRCSRKGRRGIRRPCGRAAKRLRSARSPASREAAGDAGHEPLRGRRHPGRGSAASLRGAEPGFRTAGSRWDPQGVRRRADQPQPQGRATSRTSCARSPRSAA